MKHTAALVASLVLLTLGSPLLGLEGLASPSAEGVATESTTLSFTNTAVQAAPPLCANSTLSTDLGMTAAECAEVFGCCVCRQRVPGMGCIDWQGC